MFSRLLFFAALAIPTFAQDPRILSSVKGMVVTNEPLAGNRLLVTLAGGINGKQLARSYVGGDGSFEFRDVPPGVYTVELAAIGGDTIEQQTVSLNSSGDRIELRLPVRENKLVGSGTVSVRQLQEHPVSANSKKMFEAAQKASAAGDYLKAIGILKGALKDASVEPYARMNIGVAYIKSGQADLAIPELEEAARLMPDDAVARMNLAYALLMTRRFDEAEGVCRRALQLDRNNYKAHWVMGSILLNKGSHEEGVEELHFASREIPKARVLLAEFYERNGQKDAAARELREFLPLASPEDRAKVEQWLSKLTTK